MFKEAEGPTALRVELVQALSLSVGVADLETPDAYERCCGGLVGVWNGRKGFVAVLVRMLDRPAVRRFVYSEPLESPEDVQRAVEAGMGFAELLGLVMDSPEFEGLDPAEKRTRVKAWNDIRKVSREPKVARELPPRAAGPDAAERAERPTAVPDRAVEDAAAHGDRPAILGKVSLVRRQEGGEAAPHPLVRLLSYF